MFGREHEWRALSSFATDPRPGAMLGVVRGQHRQGKSFLLRALCEAAGGFYFAADEAGGVELLRALGERLATWLDRPGTSCRDWREAIDALLLLGKDKPVPVV